MNYSEQMRRLADDYYGRRISRADYLSSRRLLLINMDAALNGTNRSEHAPTPPPADDVTQPKYKRGSDEATTQPSHRFKGGKSDL